MHIIVFETETNAINLNNHCNNCHIIIGQLLLTAINSLVDSCDNLFITSIGSCDNIHYKQHILQTLPSTAFKFVLIAVTSCRLIIPLTSSYLR